MKQRVQMFHPKVRVESVDLNVSLLQPFHNWFKVFTLFTVYVQEVSFNLTMRYNLSW